MKPTPTTPFRPWLRAALAVGSAAALLLALVAGARAQDQDPAAVVPDANGFIPRASVVEIMDAMVMPAANVLWNAVGVTVTEAGVIENAPETDEDWQRLRWSAIALAESTNVLLVPGRRIAPPGTVHEESDPSLSPDEIEALIEERWPAWVGMAHVLDAAALEAQQAIDARDVDKLVEVGGTIDAACESCHLQFWYPETP